MRSKLSHAVLLLFSLSATTLTAADAQNKLLLYKDDFENGAGHWQPTDPAAWTVKDTPQGKVYSLVKQSDYKPKHRSPLNFALLKDVSVGDFTLDLKIKSTTKDYPHRDMCLVFGYQDPARFYYVHFGKTTDKYANQIFIVNNSDRAKISNKTSSGTPWDDKWHHVRLVRNVESGAIEVYFDDMGSPAMTATDKTFARGQIGIGSFDDLGEFDDVKLYGPAGAREN